MTSRHAIITHQTVLANPRIDFFSYKAWDFDGSYAKLRYFCCYFV